MYMYTYMYVYMYLYTIHIHILYMYIYIYIHMYRSLSDIVKGISKEIIEESLSASLLNHLLEAFGCKPRHPYMTHDVLDAGHDIHT